MRDKLGDHNDSIDTLFEQLNLVQIKLNDLIKRIVWLENPSSIPKAPKTKQAPEPEGKL